MCNIGNNPVHPKRQESAQLPQPAAVPSVRSHFKSNLLNGKIGSQVKLPALSFHYLEKYLGDGNTEHFKENQGKFMDFC